MSQQFKSQIGAEEGIKIDKQLYDAGNSAGTSGYLLSSTGTATSWIDPTTIAVNVPNLPLGRLFVGTSANTSLTSDVVYIDDANDRVGIGTPSPGAKFQVDGSNSNGLIQAYVTSGGGNALRLNTNFVSGNYIDLNPYVTGVSNGGFEILQNGTQRLVISSSGNVGIGETNPSARLEVKSAAPDTFFADFISSTGSGSAKIYENSNSHPSLYMADATGTTTIVLNSSGASYLISGNIIIGGTADNGNLLQVQGTGHFYGNVGIGTPSPNHELVVQGTSSPNIELKNSNYSTGGFVLNRTNYTQQWKWWAESSIMYFGYATDESTYSNVMSIQNNGNTNILGDLTVSGGDITLSGTGRIQGVDTVSANTDAANKLYVDNAVAGVSYIHPTHPGDDIDVDTGPLTGAVVVSDIDINITTDTLGHVTDANGVISTRTLTLADLGYTGATNANNYVHPTHPGDDINLDTGALTGATVISDLDFNITTDTLGHVTDANATFSTRNLTASDVGATPLDDIRSLGTQEFTGTATTDGLISEMETDGAFDSYSSVFKTSWSYAGNFDLTDAGRFTETAGTSWITWTDNSSDSTRGNITALAIAPNTGGSAGKVFIYNDQGSTYNPGWREVWTSTSDGSGSGLDADLLDGQHASAFQAAGTYNTIIGTDTDISYTGATVLSTMTMTDGVVQSHSSRNLTASDVGAAASSHTHPASDIVSGTLADARLSSNVFLDRGDIDVTTVTDGSNSNPFDDAHSETKIAENGMRTISYTGASAFLYTWNNGGSASVVQLGAHYNGDDFYMRVRTDGSNWRDWKKLWHNGNDGAGSGLDADLLDGQQGSYYASAASLGNYLPLAGGTMTGTNGVLFPDGFKLNIGTGSDLQIHHDGSNSYINESGTGRLILSGGSDIQLQSPVGEFMADFNSNGSVDLYYDNSKKFETTSTGVTVTGIVEATGGNSTEWNTAYDNSITAATVTGTTTKTLTLTQQDGGTVTANWSDETGSGLTGSGTTNYIPKWSSSSALTDSTIIDSSGNIGINISSPSKRLHIGTSSNSVSTTEEFRIQTGANGGFGGNAVINLQTGNYGTSGIYMGDSGAISYSSQPGKIEWIDFTNTMEFTSVYAYRWKISTSTKMYMTTDGDVGIGTTNPAEKLEVVGNIKANNYINQRVAWNSTFSHTTGANVWIYIPVAYITEQTADAYYLNWIAAYGGRVRKVVLRGAGTGNTQTATTTLFRVMVNGSTVYTTGTLTVTGTSPNKVVSYEFDDSDAVFSATDRVQVLFNSNGLWYNAAVGIIIEYTE
jgi:hypothetical protein